MARWLLPGRGEDSLRAPTARPGVDRRDAPSPGFTAQCKQAVRRLCLALILAALIGLGLASSASVAFAGCDGANPTDTCTGAISGGIVVGAAPITTLDVNTLSNDVSQISLTGAGQQPQPAPNDFYTCSVTNNGAGCTIAAGPPPTCTAKDSNSTCVINSGGAANPSNGGPQVTIVYTQPTATATISNIGSITTSNTGAVVAGTGPAVVGASFGSDGGGGSNAYVFGSAGNGGDAADGGVVNVSVNGAVVSSSGAGVVAVSAGGNGGDGGNSYSVSGSAGSGGLGGAGGNVQLHVTGTTLTTIETFGANSDAVHAVTQGGHGGNSGDCHNLVCSSSNGGNAAFGGTVTVTTDQQTQIVTWGDYSNGIYAASIGGFGGNGGSSSGLVVFGSTGASAGPGGSVTVFNDGSITTHGTGSYGIFAQSIGGGGGGAGQSGGLVALGASGAQGGNGGTVTVRNTGAITTTGDKSVGIFAQSIGGTGGDGGSSGGLVAIGGNASGTSIGSTVSVNNSNTVTTSGTLSAGIFAQSIGGGGGNGGSGSGLFTMGGAGGGGGAGGAVTVTNSGSITTGNNISSPDQALNSAGIFAQSVGGGGGNGGGAVSGSVVFGAAFGGTGGSGGDGGVVQVLRDTNHDVNYAITTHGDQSDAVFAQSVGGGGGNGGFAVSAAVGGIAIALGVGAGGGPGGNGQAVTVQTRGSLTTTGASSDGIFAQSAGGGGGNGGAAITGAVGGDFSATIGIGGKGGNGGNAGTVTVSNLSDVSTSGDNSNGIVAQSVGGGGGNGGYAVSGSVSAVGLSFNLGGSGASGGTAGSLGTIQVEVDSSGSFHTRGNNSDGIVAQAIGGGGGNGGFTASVNLSAGGALGLGIAGDGGGGQSAGDVLVNANSNTHTITGLSTPGTWNLVTEGGNSVGIFAESVGGGGGNGGFSGSLTAAGLVAVGVNLGGDGGTAGNAGNVTVNNGQTTSNSILTLGDNSSAILAQSIGGSGGNGGGTVTVSASGAFEGIGAAAAVGIGGDGNGGGTAAVVTVTSTGNIRTNGNNSNGILAQSVGGSGGNGGFSAAGSFTAGFGAASVAVGGKGAGGQSAGNVIVTSTGNIETHGTQSDAILAQSIGGGGGNGGFAGSGSASLNGVGITVGVGGSAGTGANAGTVQVTSTGSLTATQSDSIALLAQSVGGGGGNGGSSVGLSLGADAALGVNLGRTGGSGGDGTTVTVISTGNIVTGALNATGGNSTGILAQSVGGGGGNGGFVGGLSASTGAGALGVQIAGNGGDGGNAGIVTVTSVGNVTTYFDNSTGILAQSLGGGGGNGGLAVSASGSEDIASASVAVGGKGAGGGIAGNVTVTSTGTVATWGNGSTGILAQSIGGGGGNGGFALSGTLTFGSAGVNVGVGGSGSSGGTPGAATVNSYSVVQNGVPQVPTGTIATLSTFGNNADGILAQSIAGGGGNGGWTGGIAIGDLGGGASVTVGGKGGAGANANTATVLSYNNILTTGSNSAGISAQSLGGGGGNGGFALSLAGGVDYSGAVAVGGSGNSGGSGNTATVTSYGNITTEGSFSHGIFAQSVGGGGGNGGGAVSGSLTTGPASLALGIGGKGQAAGDANAVTVTSTGDINTGGKQSDGILAQSVGGGGGNGGFAGSIAANTDGGSLGITIGGSASGGGAGKTVSVTSNGDITTTGDGSSGIFAQSVGGGGGNGGSSVGISGATQASASIVVGGGGGSGVTAGTVTVDNTGRISTGGAQADGIWAQSVGGGGGNGGFAVSGTLTVDATVGVSVGVGGKGGSGGNAMSVTVNSNVGTAPLSASIVTIGTTGVDANGIYAQSVGGGGGGGGFSGAVSVITGTSSNAAISASVGGQGNSGGAGAIVNVTSVDNIRTISNGANGIFAQSVGGGGGNGGFSFAGAFDGNLAPQGTTAGISATVGGNGGPGSTAAAVTVISTADITTGLAINATALGIDNTGTAAMGDHADGVLAQSIGGGGGNGGLSVALALGPSTPSSSGTAADLGAAVGGNGGHGGTADQVSVTRTGTITTFGNDAVGIMAQSIGGGGGNGGLAVSGSIAGTDAKQFTSSIGGNGAFGGTSALVTVKNTGAITTSGTESQAIYAQSIGGGGGKGGIAASGIFGITGETTSVDLAVTVGGVGGQGNTAGDVKVTNVGSLTTTGNSSQAILAQSIGGGGGNGGDSFVAFLGLSPASSEGRTITANIGVGGNAGQGGTGGNVTVINGLAVETTPTSINTSGNGSHGIEAQSVGGGGGSAGDTNSISVLLGCPSDKVCTPPPGSKGNMKLQLTVGGIGGSGNTGGTVTVTNYDAITTTGQSADGIFAQSIGGGGGNGGNAVLGTKGLFPNPAPVGPELAFKPFDQVGLFSNLGIAVGGQSGASGDGGVVTVTNSGAITVHGGNNVDGDFVNCGNNTNVTTCNSWGIWAQSVGGGGGTGGYGAAGLTGTVGVGGTSHASGLGGDVTVTNNASATITATGEEQSGGIFAQSVGGGGGGGGAGSGLLDIGGNGGDGGNGGNVTVNNYGTITTSGISSDAILAQSVGGGGGTGGGGGLSVLAVGGQGGNSSIGQTVDVTNTGTITTTGKDSNGIFAESIGGGGGRGGGNTASGVLAAASTSLISIGGSGTGGGDGGAVTVGNTGSITTHGDDSDGIFAHSVGGGGGLGGEAIGVVVSVGGSSKSGGDGLGVTVTNGSSTSSTATITTYGSQSNGIEAQSIGGGGGKAGAAFEATPIGGVAMAIGGSAGGGGKGGTIQIDNYADITTNGTASTGILAQSIGGGGGNGGYVGSFGGIVPAIGVSVGGSGGSGGKGGDVTVTNHTGATITAAGVGSTAIFAQSVGGGGGNGGAVLSVQGSTSATVSLGGSGHVAGDGGSVTVTNDGDIILTKDNSIAILAQSVGGGGGTAGSALGVTAIPVFLGGSTGATGNGGTVTVTNSGSITIQGNNSIGIFAQSIGGGGGLIMPGGGAGSVTSQSGGSGNGLAVTINNTASNIIMIGNNDIGVFGQSVGGGGGAVGGGSAALSQTMALALNAAAIGGSNQSQSQLGALLFSNSANGSGTAAPTVFNQTGNAVMTGVNSIGLVAQSSAPQGSGPITVNILNPANSTSVILGGSGQGTGVAILGGTSNALNNYGIISSVLNVTSFTPSVSFFGANGSAVTGTTGDDTINNYNFMLGSVDLGTGTNALNNKAGAIYWSGISINLGTGAADTLTNDGVIAPGGPSNVLTTSITGNFVQSAGAVFALDLDLTPNTLDRINASGTANVSGTIPINILNPGMAQTGDHPTVIVHTGGGETHGPLSLSFIPSAITTYRLLYTQDDILLDYNINYSPPSLSGNQASVGNAINEIQSTRTVHAFVPVGSSLFYIPDVTTLGKAYDALSGEGTSGTEQTAFLAGQIFNNATVEQITAWLEDDDADRYQESPPLLAYASTHGFEKSDALAAVGKSLAPPKPSWHAWGTYFGESELLSGDATVGSAGLRDRSSGGGIGADYQPNRNLLFGFATGGMSSSFSVPDRLTTGTIEGGYFGLYGVARSGGLYAAATASYGSLQNGTQRLISGVGVLPAEKASATFPSHELYSHFEVGDRMPFGRFVLTPLVAFDYAKLWEHGYSEVSVLGNGTPGILGLTFASIAPLSTPLFLGGQIDGNWVGAYGLSYTPFLRAGWVHEFQPDRAIYPSLTMATAVPFMIEGARAPSDALRLDAGLKINLTRDAGLFANFHGEFSSGSQSYAGSGGVRYAW